VGTSGLVTILFTDLVGSTDLGSRIGDVAADDLRRDHFADLRGAIVRTGGVEVKTIGDAVMVSYSSASDALAGAVEMQQSVERHNRRSTGPVLAMRVGVSAGDATFEDDDWFGTPVVEAARLCAAADSGQILISDLVRALAGSRSDVTVSSLGERELKGLPAPISVSEVEWSIEAPAVEQAIPLPGFVELVPTFPFAGRAHERERLVTAWKEAAEGARRVVLVSGEPGVGKTRLVTEVVKLAHDQGALLLWGRCAEELDVPYQPFAEALRHYVHSVPLHRLQAELGPLGGELTRLIPDLAHLVPSLPEPVRTESETERHRLFEAVADLLQMICLEQPVVLVLDDVHWADKPSLLLLRHLLRRSSSTALLILATYRDTDLERGHPLAEVLADLRREPGVERVDLQGLDPGEVTSFMEHAAGHDLTADGLALAAAVHQETQGNPFFIGEMLLHLAESGLIVHREGRWQSDFTLAEVGIPEGIREVIGRRLSRLSDTANAALSIGAVLGPEFDVSLVEALSGADPDALLDALDEAARASIVREVVGVFGRYAFAHALVRSTLYGELSTNRRVRMHWQVTEAIEARHPHDLDDHLDALAHHSSEGALAGDPRKAVDYAGRAATRAIDDLAFEAAVRHLDRALAALELVADASAAERFDLELLLTTTLRAASDPRFRDAGFAAAATARRAGDAQRLAVAAAALTGPVASHPGFTDAELIDLFEEALDGIGDAPSPLRARLLSGLAVEINWGPDAARRRRLATEALEMARATGDPAAMQQALLGGWTLLDGSAPFMEDMRALTEEAERQGWDDPVANFSLRVQQLAHSATTGDRTAAQRHLQDMREIAEALRQPRFVWMCRNHDAALQVLLGEVARAEELAISAMTYGLEHGVSEDNVMGSLGAIFYAVRRAQGRIDELVPSIEELVRTQPGLPVWRVALAGALSEGGRAEDAVEHTEWLAADHCANVPDDVEFPVTLCGLGRLTRTVPLDEDTRRYIYDRLLPFAGTLNWSGASYTDPNDHGLAMVSARLGDFAASDRHFAAAIELCERAGARPFEVAAHLDWALLLGERGDVEEAAGHAQQALALASELGMDGRFGAIGRAQRLLEGDYRW
jgi:class 3 adenylate cyclase/tetratricopeptide (TPR) repeat protein